VVELRKDDTPVIESEFLDSSMRNISLGPHEVHDWAQMPQFDAELDIEPLEGDSLRMAIEEPRAGEIFAFVR
jgi:hypothetical protein